MTETVDELLNMGSKGINPGEIFGIKDARSFRAFWTLKNQHLYEPGF